MTKRKPALDYERTETDFYLLLDGVRIAKRGRPGTPQAKTWIPLKPGYEFHDTPDLSEIWIRIPPSPRRRLRRGSALTSLH
jgi:hypothetical protein